MGWCLPTPAAFTRRAFFLCTALFALFGHIHFGASELKAQVGKRYRPLPDYVQLSEPDQKEGRRLLEEFRDLGLAGDQYWEFRLRFLPRRGDEVVVPGRLWSTRDARDVLTRIVLRPEGKPELRMLLRNGPNPCLWTWTSGSGQAVRIDEARMFLPIEPSNLRPFDLLMPYLHWQEFVFEGVGKLHQRPAHRFLMYPPASIAAANPESTGVRLWLDTQYRALVQSEIIGQGGKPTRTLTLLNLKKIGDQWMAKWIDVRDEATRDKTRIELTAAAQRVQFSRMVFEPESLSEEIRPPSADTCIQF